MVNRPTADSKVNKITTTTKLIPPQPHPKNAPIPPTPPTASNPLAFMPEEESTMIRTAFYKDDTMPKEAILKSAIGKNRPKLVSPTLYAKTHPAASLLDAYATRCPTDCGPNWSQACAVDPTLLHALQRPSLPCTTKHKKKSTAATPEWSNTRT